MAIVVAIFVARVGEISICLEKRAGHIRVKT